MSVGTTLLRELGPQVVAAVARRYGDFAAAEDAAQEALLAATRSWPEQGVPDNPRSWLIQVASRRLTDQLRADASRRRRESDVVSDPTLSEAVACGPDEAHEPAEDDTLLLLFMCCHPSLSRTSAIALTLRAVAGLTTAEIARAFLVPESTMAQRISRAKQSIASSGVGFAMPSVDEQRARLDAVLHVLYLIFNEGHTPSFGDALQRVDLSSEAIRLTRSVHRSLPGHAEVGGLLSLMRITDARRAARTNSEGELVPLDQQDRSLWDHEAIREGVALVTAALALGNVGPYQLQAAIAACHGEASTVEDTDWPQILALYGLLERMSDNPIVTLNRGVALAMVHGPEAGLAFLAKLDGDPRLATHFRLAAVRGHLHEMAGKPSEAVACYELAASRTTSTPERNYLLLKAAALRGR